MELLNRAYSAELEIKTRAKGGDGRTIVGIAVPYEYPVRIDQSLSEQFARGAFNHQVNAFHRVKVSREHLKLGGSLIGRPTLLRDDAMGLYSELRVAATSLGDETIELVKDGALTDLSVAFREKQNRRLPGNILERVTADLFEIAVVLEGAYGEAANVMAVRSENASLGNLEKARQIIASLPPLPV